MSSSLTAVVVDAIEDLKGSEIVVIDVVGRSSVTDTIVIASGSSSRQIAAIAERVVERLQEVGTTGPIRVEGEKETGWILVDGGDIIAHLMLPDTRDYYNLEKLWQDVAPGQPLPPQLRGKSDGA
ncbi:MAG: ribosome silencing factor [Gammaproteobacteria bacterium]|nr:ribosome silencing factor [Gammaproteobacteria bacterium]